MEQEGLRVSAFVTMLPPENIPDKLPLRAGWGPNIMIRGKFFPGRILDCKKEIHPGHSGSVVIGIMGRESDGLHLTHGAIIELWAGPTTPIATAEIIEIF